MIVYIDKEFKCHTENANGLTLAETDFFDGKCKEYVEGYRYIPEGYSWKREDGVVFHGEMAAPWKPFYSLDAVQRQYERELANAALILLGEVTA